MIKPDNKKVSKEMIANLKNACTNPLSKPQPFKEKHLHMDQPYSQLEGYHGPIEGDFSKIGATYVLENDKLTKKSFLNARPGAIETHNQKYEQTEELEDIQMIKQVAKLEYLEKKGFLKPEQAQKLNRLRGQAFIPQVQQPAQTKARMMIQIPQSKQMSQFIPPYEIENQNMDPNMQYQAYFEPKNKFDESMYSQQQNYPIDYNMKAQYFDQRPSMGMNQSHQFSRMAPNHQVDQRYNGYY